MAELAFQLFKKYRNLITVVLLVIFILPAIWSLLRPGFFVSDDGEWMIIRFSAFHQALADGQFPVRFLGRLNHGYGYPVANFLYPGFMYLAEIPKFLGFSFVNSVKIILGLSMVGSAIFTYFWLAKVFKRLEAVIGSLFYLLAPYHFYDLYKRGSVGEILALAVAPFILWQIERKSFFWTTIGIAFLIFSHNTLALLFLPVVIIYNLLRNPHTIRHTLYAFLLGLGLSAFFWMPAVFDLKYTKFSQTSISNFSEYFAGQELIGLATIFIFLLVPTVFITKKIAIAKHRLTLLLFVIGLISLFLSASASSYFWKLLPASFVQFPFRFLSITILTAAFLAASALSVLPEKIKIVSSLGLLLLTSIAAQPFLAPSEFFDKGEGFYTTNEGTTTVQDEYLPKWVKVKPTEHFKEKVEVIEGKANISNLVYNSQKIEFNVDSVSDSKTRINTIYFPGWKAFIDGKESAIDYGNERGVMDLPIPMGVHRLNLTFSETPLRLFGDLITILSLGFLIFTQFLRKRSW